MAGEYTLQITDGKTVEEIVFPDFAALALFIQAKKSVDWANTVNVHLPPRATDDEREALRNLGFQSN